MRKEQYPMTTVAPSQHLVWTIYEIGKTVAKAETPTPTSLRVRTNGTQLIAATDDFCFLERKLQGNGTLTAQIMSLDNTDIYAKAAVQIRQSLDDNAPNAMMEWTPSGYAYFQYRAVVNGGVDYSQYVYSKLPLWVRITREGDQITGFISEDGTNFKKVGSVTLKMPEEVHIGLAVTSNSKQATTAVIDHISLEGTSLEGGSPNQEAAPSNVRSIMNV
jgi:regulation of enolase protein 1 (concanavalin A-like superfamily)